MIEQTLRDVQTAIELSRSSPYCMYFLHTSTVGICAPASRPFWHLATHFVVQDFYFLTLWAYLRHEELCGPWESLGNHSC